MKLAYFYSGQAGGKSGLPEASLSGLSTECSYLVYSFSSALTLVAFECTWIEYTSMNSYLSFLL